MIKRLFEPEVYAKIGSPDLNQTIFFKRGGKKRYGKVVLVNHNGYKGKVQIGIEPFNRHLTTHPAASV